MENSSSQATKDFNQENINETIKTQYSHHINHNSVPYGPSERCCRLMINLFTPFIITEQPVNRRCCHRTGVCGVDDVINACLTKSRTCLHKLASKELHLVLTCYSYYLCIWNSGLPHVSRTNTRATPRSWMLPSSPSKQKAIL